MALREAPPPPKAGEVDERGLYSFSVFVAQNDHYVGFYQTWVKTILFLLGKQWLKWMQGERRYVPDTDVPPWRQQPVTNYVYAVYRVLATKLSKQKPTLEVVPPSGDSDDRESARLGQSILVHLWRLLKKPQKIRRAIGWFLCTGQVYFRVHWDPDAGKLVPLQQLVEIPHEDPDKAAAGETMDAWCPCDEKGKPLMRQAAPMAAPMADPLAQATEPLVEGADVPDAGQGTAEQAAETQLEYDFDGEAALVPEGEIAFDYVDPMSVRFNADAEDADDATEMFIGKLWRTAKAAKRFDLLESDIDAGEDGDREMYQDLMASAASGAGWMGGQNITGSQLGASQEQSLGDRSLVLEYYRKPDKTYKKGRHWISIGRKKVWPKDDDPEYPMGEAELPNGFWPPIIPVISLPIPGQPQAIGTLSQIVPLNEQLNSLDGKIKENEVTMSMGGKWVTHPADKGLQITSDPAQTMRSKGYALGYPPVQVTIKGLPEQVYNERNVLADKIRLVGSLSEVDLGKKPEGVSAGRAFLVLQEVTDSVLGPDLESFEHALEECGRRELVLAQQHYREKRKIQIRGEKGEWEVRSFDGTDLSDGMDVRVQVGSSFPWSKSAQWDTKLQILGQFPALVTRPDGSVDQEKMAEFLDTGGSGLSSFESDENPDLVEIQREHAMFEAYNPATGSLQLPELAFWQSQPKHLEGHYRFMKMDYARFLRWTPEGRAAFVEHCKLTAIAVDALAAQMVSATGAGLPGGPPMIGGQEPGAEAGGEAEGAPMAGDAEAEPVPAEPPPPGGMTPNPNLRPALSPADMASAKA